jgi:DNA-binding NtrC family response regulator
METLRILIVDDEEELVSTLAERLALRGLEIQIATNGKDALKLVREHDFTVIVADVKMPGIGGLELTGAIKRHNPELPVILFTGHSSVADAERGMQQGAFECVMKPVDIDVLIEKIRKAAAQKGGRVS